MGRDRTKLHPILQQKADEFEGRCRWAGLNVMITDTFRTVAEQNALYAKGRTVSGNIVTNARGDGYESPHQWGCAFDFCQNIKKKSYDDKEFFKRCGTIGKEMGLFWGGDFKGFVDMPHFEYTPFVKNNSTHWLKVTYVTPDKFIATWRKSGSPPQQISLKPTQKNLVAQLQQQLNEQFGCKLVVDGIWGDQTKQSMVPIKKGWKGVLVKIIQQSLNLYGYALSVDGVFGEKTEQAVKAFQKKKNLLINGVVGKITIEKLLKSS